MHYLRGFVSQHYVKNDTNQYDNTYYIRTNTTWVFDHVRTTLCICCLCSQYTKCHAKEKAFIDWVPLPYRVDIEDINTRKVTLPVTFNLLWVKDLKAT